MARHGTVRYGTARHGKGRHATARDGTAYVFIMRIKLRARNSVKEIVSGWVNELQNEWRSDRLTRSLYDDQG